MRRPMVSSMTNEQIGAMLRLMRKDEGLSQEDLASRLGVSQARVSQIESKGPARLSGLNAFADACGVQLIISWRSSRGKERAPVDKRVRGLLYHS
jgi:transcriptional regulator with XRE-family HTH domain